jgi:DNA-binding LacI/PurR family transcriptional regulator
MIAMRAAELAALSVPEDLSVACFMGDRRDYFGRALGGIALPEAEVGRRAVEMLMDRIAAPTESLPPAAVLGEWRDGETVSAPKGESNS